MIRYAGEAALRPQAEHVPGAPLEAAAVGAGMRTLRQDGWRKVQAGITSLGEVLRVSHADEFAGAGTRGNEKDLTKAQEFPQSAGEISH